MASLRNAVKRIAHKERAQPSARRHLGMLEKHSDYVERAQDFHRKQDYLTSLKRKAALRNPDEFYHGMKNKKTRGGVVVEEQDNTLDTETVKLMKTQDVGYLATVKRADEEKIRKLRANLHQLGNKKAGRHTVFVEDEKAVEDFDAAEHFDTAPELVGRAFNRPRRKQLEDRDVIGGDTLRERQKVRRLREKAYRELRERETRVAKVDRTLRHVQTQRNVMGKGTKRKVKKAENGAPAQYRWKRVRSK